MDRSRSGASDVLSVDPQSILDAIDRALIVTDPEGIVLVWNEGAARLFGWSAAEAVGRPAGELIVAEERRDEGRRLREQTAAGETWRGEFTLRHRDGHTVHVAVVNRPVRNASGEVVAIVGSSEDITSRKELEQQAADLAEHLLLALDAGGLGTFRWIMATDETIWDAKLEALFGLPEGGFDRSFATWASLLHPDDRAQVLATVERSVQEGTQYVVEHRVVWPDGTVRWLQGAGRPTYDDDGNVTGAIGCTRDVTHRVVAEQERERLMVEALAAAERERANRERLEFLGRINDILAGSRDIPVLMRRLAVAAVPRLGDWCSIHVLPAEGGVIPDVEIAHVDPAMVAHAYELQQRFPYDPAAPSGVAAVIRTGQQLFIPEINEAVLDAEQVDEEAKEEVRRLELRSAIVVPLAKGPRVLGALQLVMSSDRRQYVDDDLALANAVASRIAASFDNIRLSERHRQIAATLQAGLLPNELPALPGVELAVRYWAAGEAVEVGGDFYDVFQVDDRSWAIVTGDVCGTGPSAATVTGLARHTIATAAWLGERPAEVLSHLNDVLRRRRTDGFLTAVHGLLRPQTHSVSLELAVGGHPLPILARADGSVRTIGRSGSLLGLFDEVQIHAVTTELRPGDVLVFYTDGITDVPPPHGIEADQLAEIIRGVGVGNTSAEDVAAGIGDRIAEVLPMKDRKDDIALLVLRVASGA